MIRGNEGSGTREPGKRHAGFSLIELLVTVAVIAILASIALPSYREHVIKSRRAAGAACLTAAAQQMERFYTTQLSYEKAPEEFVCDPETAPYYTVKATVRTAKGYTLTADPQGSQDDDTKCGQLAITASGEKTPATKGCW